MENLKSLRYDSSEHKGGEGKTLQIPKKKKITHHNNFQLHNSMTLERKENSLPWGILMEDDL